MQSILSEWYCCITIHHFLLCSLTVRHCQYRKREQCGGGGICTSSYIHGITHGNGHGLFQCHPRNACPTRSCPVAQNSCMWICWVLIRHTNSWAPLHPEGTTISAGGVQKSLLNTLFRQFLFTGKSESKRAQNGPKFIHIVSSPLKKKKVLAPDSDPRN